MSPTRRVMVSAAVVAGALGVGACESGGPEPAVTTVTDTTTAPARDTAAEAPDVGQAPETDPDTDQVGDVLEVTAHGDRGVLGLQYSGPVPAGSPGPASGKLITGPGGCFAFVSDGAPQLAIFPPDATFVLQNGRPSVTVDGVEHPVGRELTADTTVVPLADAAGVPERCARGAADTVLVVH